MSVLHWLWRRFDPAEGRLLYVLLVGAALSAGLVAMAPGWVIGDQLFLHAALIGMLAARQLSRTSLRARWAALFLGITGVLYVGWAVTQMTQPAWSFISAWSAHDRVLMYSWLREAQARLATLVGELATWAGSWVGGTGSPGPLVSLFWMGLIMWAGAGFAGWSLPRGSHPLLSFLPLGCALALSTYLADEGTAELLMFLTCVVAMVPLSTLRRQQWDWDRNRIPYSELLSFDAVTAAVATVTIFLISATILPEVRVNRVVDWFWRQARGPQQASEEVLSRAFPGARQPRARSYLPPATGAVLPRAHLLSGSPALRSDVVMLVRTDDPAPLPEEFELGMARTDTFYWRGTIYGEYVGVGWEDATTRLTQVSAYDAIQPSGTLARRLLRQDFELLAPHGATLYAAADPNSVNQPVNVRRMHESDELVAIESTASEYEVLSLVPDVTAEQLEEASRDYPQSLRAEYTSLPDTLPDRVVQLAQQVTAEIESSYQRALALEAYLRTIAYDLQVGTPPRGRDVVDYFLFDLQRGYCDYFASAMVVMARAVGIPARLAVGYAMGHYDGVRGAYVVTAMDAHAWPELYFPGYGWIPFEPTSGLAPLTRLRAAEELPPPSPLVALPQRSWAVRLKVAARLLWLRWQSPVLALFACLALVCAVGWWWRWWIPGLGPEERVAWTYWRLRQMAPRFGVATSASDTPLEFSTAMRESLYQRRPRWPVLGSATEREVEHAGTGIGLLAEAYERVSYAPAPHEFAPLRLVSGRSSKLGWQLLKVWALSTPQ